jgi:hypothetical protein
MSLTEAAAQLHLHKNTVRYRLGKGEQLRGAPITHARLELHTALLAREQLAPPSVHRVARTPVWPAAKDAPTKRLIGRRPGRVRRVV